MLIKGERRHGLLSDDPDIARLLNVGMVFQNGALFDSLTVGENVGFLLYEHSNLSSHQVEVRIVDVESSNQKTTAMYLKSSSSD